ncbi:MAG: TfoX/Sxy family protein [Clostridiales Family XIII bacterium]|jgi:TfoX/Sxy family transcriptional regulator of competence genes|nr:TfoX/Sxy family protein [Clostridiales Family XIII bacterium]
MATSPEYIEFVCDSVRTAFSGDVRHKKMFGEYMVYVNDKPLVLVCDDTAFVKMLPCLADLMADAPQSYPYSPEKYPGAKLHYILDVEDRELTGQVIRALEEVVPVPRPKKPKRQ